MVIPEGECADAIGKSSPAMSFSFGNLQFGEICASSFFNSSHQYVIYTRCSDWSGGRGEVVGITI